MQKTLLSDSLESLYRPSWGREWGHPPAWLPLTQTMDADTCERTGLLPPFTVHGSTSRAGLPGQYPRATAPTGGIPNGAKVSGTRTAPGGRRGQQLHRLPSRPFSVTSNPPVLGLSTEKCPRRA